MEAAVVLPHAQVAEETAGSGTGEGSPRDVVDPRTVAPRDARQLSRQFFQRLTELEEGTHAYQYARNTLIEMNMSLVRFAAGRFRGRGNDMEDIVQTGMIGLIKAIDRFELSREVEFTSFALPYIVGEIKRFFRDTTWPCTCRGDCRSCAWSWPGRARSCPPGWTASPPSPNSPRS